MSATGTARTQSALMALLGDRPAQIASEFERELYQAVRDVVATLHAPVDSVTPTAAPTFGITDAGTNTVTTNLSLSHNSSGTPAAGLGAGLAFKAESTTTADTLQGVIESSWVTATHASRAGQVAVSVYSVASKQTAFEAEGDSGGVKIGFFGATPVAKPTALTAAEAGAVNTGDAGSDTVITNMRTRIGEIATRLVNLGLLTS